MSSHITDNVNIKNIQFSPGGSSRVNPFLFVVRDGAYKVILYNN